MTIWNVGNSTLEGFDYGAPGWVHVYNTNIEKLNATLLKINELRNVDTQGLRDGAILVWNATTQKWRCKTFTP